LGLLTGRMTGYLKAEDNQALLLMLGALGVAFGQVINFWLGSTDGSQAKDVLWPSRR
jgi:membrane protein DedA with SNARE-associated domain